MRLLSLEAAVVAVRRSVVHGQVQVVVAGVEAGLVGARVVVVVVVVHVAVGDAALQEVVVVQGEQVLQGRDVGGRRQGRDVGGRRQRRGHHHRLDGGRRRVWWGRVGGGTGLVAGMPQHEGLHGWREAEQHGVVGLDLRLGGRLGVHAEPLAVGVRLRLRGRADPLP